MKNSTGMKWAVGAIVAIAACISLVPLVATAGDRRPDAREKRTTEGKELTFVGYVYDVHSYMASSKPSEDTRVMSDAIKGGVPAMIDSPAGAIILNQGAAGSPKTFAALANQRVQVTGKFYEKNGLKYLDVASAREATRSEEAAEESDE